MTEAASVIRDALDLHFLEHPACPCDACPVVVLSALAAAGFILVERDA